MQKKQRKPQTVHRAPQGRPPARRGAARAAARRRRAFLVLLLCAVALVACLVVARLLRGSGPTGPETLDIGTPAGAWQKNGNGIYFNDAGQPILAAVKKGIDVSKYQGEVDWEAAKAAGIDFAILRCGYGGEWSGQGDYKQDDDQWRRNADECTRLGIPFGVYLYSYAVNVEDAISEADHVARLLGLVEPPYEGLEDYTATPYRLDYPVYYDLEDKYITGLLPDEMAAIVQAFFDRLESHGYTGRQGIYASLNWVRGRLDDAAFDPWRDELWIARFSSDLGYTGPYAIWQATCTEPGAAYGVQSETVDIDFLMEELAFTGIAEGSDPAASFTNDTYTDALWLPQKGAKATLLTNQPAQDAGGQQVFWQSSDPKVATVDKNGVVKAKADGECTVTATLADGRLSAECTVRVGSVSVPVLATGNLAGRTANGVISLADVAALKTAAGNAILLDTGGSLQGSENTSLTGGMDMTSAFAAAGYDLQCFDAADLAFGAERLLSDVMTATGPALAANLLAETGEPLFYRSNSWNRNRITNGMNTVVKRAGKQIGFFALAGAGNTSRTAGLTVAELTTAATEQVSALKAKGADAIVCILGPDAAASFTEGSFGEFRQVLQVLGVNLLVNGAQTATVRQDPLPELPTGSALESVARADLVFLPDGTVEVQLSSESAEALKTGRDLLDGDARTGYENAAAALQRLDAGDSDLLGQVLFTFAENGKTIGFGNYVAELYAAVAEADRSNWPEEAQALPLAALAGGTGELEFGEITRGLLLDALPAGERLVLVQADTTAIARLVAEGAVAETYLESLISNEETGQAAMLVTDTATVQALGEGVAVVRDYGDAYWTVRMAINDATGGFQTEFVLPAAPNMGTGRG